MRLGLYVSAAAAALCVAAPANASVSFNIDAMNPRTVSTYGRYIRFTFSAQVLSPDGSFVSAMFNAEPGYIRNSNGTYQNGAPVGGLINSDSPTSFYSVANYMTGEFEYSQNLYTFTTSSDQIIRIIDFTATSDEPRGPRFELPVTFLPEPDTWLMLLAGFSMIGAAARYRKRSATLAYDA